MSKITERYIRKEALPDCLLCGIRGEELYRDLRDRLFGASGTWNLKRCDRCGLLWLDPMPLPDDIGLAYENYYTHRDEPFPNSLSRRVYAMMRDGYIARRFGYKTDLPAWKKLLGTLIHLHPGRRDGFDHSVMYLKARPGGTLLEIGCGTGTMLGRLKGLGWRVEGVDFDPSAVANAKKRGLEVRLGTLEAQGYPDGCFDAVVMSHVMEHVHDTPGFLKECFRVLKKGGVLVSITPNGESLGHRLFREAWRGLDVPRHLFLFTPDSISRFAANAGFSSVELRVTVRTARGIYRESRAIREALRSGAGRISTVRPGVTSELWQFMEWCMSKLRPECGEELVLICTK